MPLKPQRMIESLRELHERVRPWVRWWLGELRLLWNDALDRLLPAARVVTELRARNDGFELVRRRGSEILATHELAGLADPLPEGVAGTRAILVLPAQDVLVRRLHLPAAIEPKLRESLALRIDHDMPLRSELVAFDFVVVARDARKSVIEVDLAIVRRTCVEEWARKLRETGLRPIAIGARVGQQAGDNDRPAPENLPPLLNFLPRRGETAHSSGRRATIDRPLAVSAAILAIAVVGVLGWQWRAERIATHAAIVTLRADAQSAQADRQRLLEQIETAKALRASLSGRPLGATLADLSTHIGPEAWIQTLQFRGAEVRLQGIGTNAAGLVAQLERSPSFERVTLASTASAGLGTGEDRFEVALQTREPAP